MISKAYQSYAVGDELPPLDMPPVTRLTLALYCGGAGDHNPVHVDSDYARAHGQPDVFVHGMLSMAYLGRLLTEWAPQSVLRSFNVRFTQITNVHDSVSCAGRVTETFEADGVSCLRVEVTARSPSAQTILGEAVIALAGG